MSWLYMLTLVIVFVVALVLELRGQAMIFSGWRERIGIVGTIFLVGVAWDSFAIWRGLWTYSADQTLGATIGVMPLEDYLFMVVVPYFCIVVYASMRARARRPK